MFVNCSNHKIENWSKEQLEAAEKYGQITDYAFPLVDAAASSEEIMNMAQLQKLRSLSL